MCQSHGSYVSPRKRIYPEFIPPQNCCLEMCVFKTFPSLRFVGGTPVIFWGRADNVLETNISYSQPSLLSQWYSELPKVGYGLVPWRVPCIPPEIQEPFTTGQPSFQLPERRGHVCRRGDWEYQVNVFIKVELNNFWVKQKLMAHGS